MTVLSYSLVSLPSSDLTVLAVPLCVKKQKRAHCSHAVSEREGCPPALRQSVSSISGSGTVCTFLLNPRKNKKANTAVSLLKSANFAASQEKGILLRKLAMT